ncbi:hypothetical protein ACLOJK_005356 [Asimina triloba]
MTAMIAPYPSNVAASTTDLQTACVSLPVLLCCYSTPPSIALDEDIEEVDGWTRARCEKSRLFFPARRSRSEPKRPSARNEREQSGKCDCFHCSRILYSRAMLPARQGFRSKSPNEPNHQPYTWQTKKRTDKRLGMTNNRLRLRLIIRRV